MKTIPATLCFYETPHRLGKSLIDCLEILGNRNAAVTREITKMHEESARGTLSELVDKFADESVRGEIVLTIDRSEILDSEPRRQNSKSIAERVSELEDEGFDRKIALKKAAKEFGLPRSEAYRIWQTEK